MDKPAAYDRARGGHIDGIFKSSMGISMNASQIRNASLLTPNASLPNTTPTPADKRPDRTPRRRGRFHCPHRNVKAFKMMYRVACSIKMFPWNVVYGAHRGFLQLEVRGKAVHPHK